MLVLSYSRLYVGSIDYQCVSQSGICVTFLTVYTVFLVSHPYFAMSCVSVPGGTSC